MSLKVKGQPMTAGELRKIEQKLDAIITDSKGVNFSTLMERLSDFNTDELQTRWGNLFTGNGKTCPPDVYQDRDLLLVVMHHIAEIEGMLATLQHMLGTASLHIQQHAIRVEERKK
jgi:hypothetical protein